jgi:TatD DNase family protein
MLIDSHCHLASEKYKISPLEIIKDAESCGVEKFITIGTSMKENLLAIEAAKLSPKIFCSVGIYPHEDKGVSIYDLRTSLRENLKTSEKIIAVGECGVDNSGWENGRTLDEQLEVFEMQIEFAKENKLPIIVHDRKGDEEVLKLLEKHSGSGLRGVVHCFDSSWEFAQKILDLGFYISFTNLITYPKKDELLEVVRQVPMNRFLVETDAPYLPPQSHRGELNYPKYVKIVAEKVAQVKQKTFEEVCASSYENTCSLFDI